MLRTAAGRDPHDKPLQELVGELSTRSDEFRRRWTAHDVRIHGGGVKRFHHHVVGDLTLAYETVDLTAEPGLSMTIYAAEPGSSTEQALALLASWAAPRASKPQPSRGEATEPRACHARGSHALSTWFHPDPLGPEAG
jgi:hypothetical protein